MDYTQSLSFAFEEPEWARKLLIGGLLAWLSLFTGIFLFIGVFIIAGYALGVIRNVVRDEATILPAWGDFGRIFIDGLLAVIIAVVYAVILGAAGALYFVFTATATDLPGGPMALAIISGAVLLYLALKLSIGVAQIRLAASNNLGEALNFRLIVQDIRADLPALLSIVLFTSILHLILFLAGLGIISPFLNFWGLIVEAHLFGQYGRRYIIRSSQGVEQDSLTARVS
jgi:hypothetical protein